MPERAGSTQELAKIVAVPVTTIAEVAERLGEVHDYALRTTTAGDGDGIACFSGLYRTITQTVDVTPYEDRDFLVRLDLEFARRYFDAIGAYATDRHSAPRPWRLLFDARSHPDIERVQFASAGVNAHINFDLAAALLNTWTDFPPNDVRHRDYDTVDATFARHMDELRQYYDAPFGSSMFDHTALDRISNVCSDLLVRATRAERLGRRDAGVERPGPGQGARADARRARRHHEPAAARAAPAADLGPTSARRGPRRVPDAPVGVARPGRDPHRHVGAVLLPGASGNSSVAPKCALHLAIGVRAVAGAQPPDAPPHPGPRPGATRRTTSRRPPERTSASTLSRIMERAIVAASAGGCHRRRGRPQLPVDGRATDRATPPIPRPVGGAE